MPALTATLVITAIPTQAVGVPFQVSGTYQLNESTWTDQLIYEDNSGQQVPIASPAVNLGISSWSYTHPGNLPAGNHTVQVKDPLTGTLVTSNTFLVTAGKSISVTAITSPVAGTAFVFAGTITGYTAAPPLTYQLTGPISGTSAPSTTGAVTGVTSLGWSMNLTVATAGSYRLTASDGTTTSPAFNFTVSPATVNHQIIPNQPGFSTSTVTYLFNDTFTSLADVTDTGGVPTGVVQTVLAGTTQSFTDPNGNVWTISSGGEALSNGVAPAFSANVAQLCLVQGVVWQENNTGSWYSFTGGTWVPGNNPLQGGVNGSWMNHYAFGGSEYTLSANDELEYYTSSTRTPGFTPFSLQPGGSGLVITVDSTPQASFNAGHTPSNSLSLPYNSGVLCSATETSGEPTPGLFSFTYGLIEVQMLCPAGHGFWPGISLYRQDGMSGELDIMECGGLNTTEVFGSIHSSTGGQGVGVTVTDYSKNRHIYAANWQPNTITWLVDGVQYASYPTPTDFIGHAYYITIDLAVQGNPDLGYDGVPDATTPVPSQMLIDFVRVSSGTGQNTHGVLAVPAGSTFTFTGSLVGYTSPPSLTYTINNSTPQVVTGVTSTGWSMSVVAPATVGAYQLAVSDGPTSGSVTLNVSAAVKTITVTPPTNVTAGQSFTFTGVMTNYATIPALSYTISPGGSPVTMTGVSVTGWATTVTVATAGNYTVTVTDGTITSQPAAFTVTPVTVTQTSVTWNPSDLSGVALSNNNRTATATGSATSYSTPQGVRATTALSSSQILAWEVTFTSITQNCAVGVANAQFALNSSGGLGADNNGLGAYPSTGTGSQPAQTVYSNSAQLSAGNGVASVAGAVISCVTNGSSFYFSDLAMRSTSGVIWNNSTQADPVKNVGGFPLTNIGNTYFPVYTTGESGSSAVLNDGSSAFSAFLAAYITANPSVVSISGQTSTTPSKAISPAAPSGAVVGAGFTFSGALTGYTTAPTLTYALNGAAAAPLLGVTATGWSATLVSQVAGTNTIVVSDGTINNQVSFTVSTQSNTTTNRVVAPLSGSVTTGTWILNQRFTLANSPSGIGYMQYNVLLPAQYSTNFIYPVLFVGHPNDNGMNGSSYPAPGANFVTGDAYGGNYSLDSMYNTVVFRTAHPCILVAPQCDQSIDLSGANGNANFGGYNDSQNSGWNENAVNGVLAAVLAQYSCDKTACYHIGYSLSGISTLAQLVDNNQYNGPGIKQWTAGITYSDQLYRPATPNSSVFSRMSSVPLLTISTSSDNVPSSYDQPAWTAYTGNSAYPTQANYDNGGMPAIRAGSTNYYYINFGSANPATTFMPMNALGGDGDQAYAWLFSQTSGASGPSITGVTFTPAATVVANSATNTVAGTLLATSSGAALTGITYTLSPSANFTTSGASVQFANSSVAAGTYTLTATVVATNAANSPQSFTVNVIVTAGVSPAGTFKVSGGKVLTPSGATFVGRGVCFWDNQFQGGVTNAACQPLLTLFPGTNMVRLARVSSTFWSPSTYAQQINWLTAQNIVVVIENHVESNGATGGGGQGQVYSGSLLSQEQAWYSALATYFLGNPYVWFGTCNEPPIDPSLLALWQWQQTTYNTIRATGSNTIVEIEQYNPYLQGSNSGLSNTIFSTMHNIVYGPHYYSWIWGGNGSTVVPQSTIYNGAIGSTNAQYGGIVEQIATLQTLTSQDGVVPVGCLEFGPSTTGTGVDASGLNCVAAVIQAVANNNLFCFTAWLWGNVGDDNLQNSSGGVQSPYGTMVAAAIAQSVQGLQPPAPAQALGFKTLVKEYNFSQSNKIDYSTTAQSGFDWYLRGGIGASASNAVINTSVTPASISNGNSGGGLFASSAPAGILTLNGPNAPGNGNVIISSTPPSTQLVSNPGFGVFGPNVLIEFYSQFQYNVTGNNQWYAIWFDTQLTTGSGGQYEEIDLMEVFCGNFGYPTNRQTCSGHEWTSTGNPANSAGGTYGTWTGPNGTGTWNETVVDNNWHKWSLGWVATGTNTGQLSVYYDDVVQYLYGNGTPDTLPYRTTGPGGTAGYAYLTSASGLYIKLGGPYGTNANFNFSFARVWGP